MNAPPAGRAGRAVTLGVLAWAAACATYRPPRDLAYARTSITSGGRRVAVERFAPAAGAAPNGTAPAAPRPGALVLHTSAGIGPKTGAETRRWAEALARRGVVAYVVHYFDRTGQRHTDDATEERLWPAWTATVGDALAALRRDPAVDTARAGVVGLSLGGYLALALGAGAGGAPGAPGGMPNGANAARPSSLVVVSGGFYPGVAARVEAARVEAARVEAARVEAARVEAARAETARADSAGRAGAFPPTLLLHGTADGAVPFREAERVDRALARAGVAHVLVPFAGEDHLLAPGSRPAARDTAARFLADPRGFVRAFVRAAGTAAGGR